MLLAIDTSTRYGGVCLRDEKRVVASLTWYSPRNHTRELLPAIQQILKQAECSASMLSTVMVALGPGGFSALRVGVSVAKGMALSLGIPLVGAGTLEMESYPYAEMGLPVCPLLDMGRGEVAAALYSSVDGEWRKVMGEEVQSVEALVESLRHRAHERVLFCGEGLEGREEALRQSLGGVALVASPYTPTSRLWALARVGWERYDAHQTDDVATLQPHYLRRPTIGAPPSPRPVSR